MVTRANGGRREYDVDEVHRARLPSRDGLKGNSPVMDVRESIALEIVAEKFGAGFFGNGAMPGIAFEFTDASAGFKTDEERHAFMDEFQERFGKRNRFKAILPPKGIKVGTQLPLENNKAQFIELRMLQRTIVAGAFGVPPHLVGDLSKGTFNNVEQQGIEFKQNVILPLTRIFEAAMERDLLTVEDRNRGVIIRFNPDGDLRGDFKTRQEGLAIMRQNGVINANEWREHEGMNPRADDGGDDYYATGPSGQAPAGGAPSAGASGDQEDDSNAA
jgi:HK97 family phage portal protein